ncbi:Alpha/Beta hydrolase protein [Suillus paluster]|uniref:Alpha/Beta hydrolase protein n=1 Tax=Suillus paluster TaxID=48578 RepID=UPI001B8804D2|nr:Alpha/Beta hydrolase protein [Suillus paluster]KAG1743636.1 Alpha/Beta hydrolase protein [Suillus paluster]
MSSTSFHRLTRSLLVLPPLFLTVYLLASFPRPPTAPIVHTSLAHLPSSSPSWNVYPEDFYTGGAYANLPLGRVRYWLIGPEDGRRVVLIHGLSIPAIVWKDVAPVLASQGYRVLLYDLYGRGYSDAPQVTYDTTLHTTQLALLMQHIKWDNAFIIGLSMGGGIATAFSVHFPHLVNGKVALVASAGIIESSDLSRTAKFMSSPLVQTVSALPPFQHYMRLLANTSKSSELLEINPIQEIVRLQSAHLPHYNAAVASCLRDGPIRGLHLAFQTLARSSNQVLLIHGTADKTVPYKYAFQIRNIVPPADLVTISDGGHDITVTHASEVNAALLHFLSDEYSYNPRK